MVTLLYKTKSNSVVTLNFGNYSSLAVPADDKNFHVFDSGLPSPSCDLGVFFQGKMHKIYKNAGGELLFVRIEDDGTETTLINFGTKNWQSAYLLNIDDVQVIVIGKTDLEITYYAYDSVSTSYPSYTWTDQGSRIWHVYVYSGKIYLVSDSYIYSFYVGGSPEVFSSGFTCAGGVLCSYGGSLYGVFPASNGTELKRYDSATGSFVDISSFPDLQLTQAARQAAMVVYDSKLHMIIPHMYGRVYGYWDMNSFVSLGLPYEAAAAGMDSCMYLKESENRLFLFGRTYISSSVCWDLTKQISVCKVSDKDFIWHYV